MSRELKQTWETLCKKYTSDTALINSLWQELEQAYTASDRHYHTLDHLAYMLDLASKYKPDAHTYTILAFAIFYHDIVYNPTRNDNEARCAILAAQALSKLGLSANQVDVVEEMIIATRLHQQHQNPIVNLLLDLDLAILGSDWATYDTYRKAIRLEYGMYPDAVYRSGRISVLENFLAKPYIYQTPYFRERLEQHARENIQKELRLLN